MTESYFNGTATERVRAASNQCCQARSSRRRTSLGGIHGTSGGSHATEVSPGVVNSLLSPRLLTARTRSVAVHEMPESYATARQARGVIPTARALARNDAP